MGRKLNEADHQTLVVCWAKKMSLAGREELDLMFHVPNGEKRDAATASKLKRLGVKAGVPDLLLPLASKCGKFNNLWIEMKYGDGKASETQEKWHRSLERSGGRVVVAWDWKNAVEAICEHLGGEWPEVDMSGQVSRMK